LKHVTDTPHSPVTKVVLTGGPCAGKTTALAYLGERLAAAGVAVYTVPEAATLIFGAGVNIGEVLRAGKVAEFQRQLLTCQIELEDRLAQLAELSRGERPAVILCDRGALDNAAYMEDGAFDDLVISMGLSVSELRERYDAVVCLVTAADGAEEHYNLDNDARSETPEEARALDLRTRQAWTGHEHLTVIGNRRDGKKISFTEKLRWLEQAVSGVVGIPAAAEIERKYLLREGAAEALLQAATEMGVRVTALDITQTYLRRDEQGAERRIRARRPQGHRVASLETVYTYTEKKNVTPLIRHEATRRLNLGEYRDLERQRDPSLGVIEKTRYNFLWEGQYFHLDRFWGLGESYELVEVELVDEADTVELPPVLAERLVGEVTEDPRWRNADIARRIAEANGVGSE